MHYEWVERFNVQWACMCVCVCCIRIFHSHVCTELTNSMRYIFSHHRGAFKSLFCVARALIVLFNLYNHTHSPLRKFAIRKRLHCSMFSFMVSLVRQKQTNPNRKRSVLIITLKIYLKARYSPVNAPNQAHIFVMPLLSLAPSSPLFHRSYVVGQRT